MRRVIDSIRIDFVEVTIDEIPGDPGPTRFEVYCSHSTRRCTSTAIAESSCRR